MGENKIGELIKKKLLARPEVSKIWLRKRPGQSKLYSNNFKSVYQQFKPPLRPEIDLIMLQDTTGGKKLIGIEFKLFKKGNSNPYYEGFSQALGYFMFGFDYVGLWHIYTSDFTNEELYQNSVHSWIYFKTILDIPIDFTPFQIKRNKGKEDLVILQHVNQFGKFVEMADLSEIPIKYTEENPMRTKFPKVFQHNRDQLIKYLNLE